MFKIEKQKMIAYTHTDIEMQKWENSWIFLFIVTVDFVSD